MRETQVTRRSVLGAGSAAALSYGLPAVAGARQSSIRPVAPPAALAPVRNFVVQKIAGGIVPSLVVQVTQRGRPIWAEAFGFADLEARKPATLDSIYKIASISKPFTVSGLMTLVDSGRVDLDAPANHYLRRAKLRAFRGSPEQMTIRRLANHTSGLPIHEMLFYDGARRLGPDETVARYGFAAWEPGSRFKYSNLGTAILGFVSADVSGLPWPEFMERSLLDPLGLTGTFAELPPGSETEAAGPAAQHLTRQYDYDISGRFVPTGAHLTSHPGASAMWSTAADLTRFARLHLDGGLSKGRRILSSRSTTAMQEFTVPSRETGVTYGNGWISHANLVRRNFNHSGGGPGMGAMLAAFPEEGVIIAVLTNYFGAMATEVTRRIAEALFGPAAPNLAVTPVPSDGMLPPGRWAGWLRHYAGDIPLNLKVAAAAAELQFGRMPPVALSNFSTTGRKLSGTVAGTLQRGPGFQGESVIDLSLRLEDGKLIGIADTYAKGYFEVAYWIELDRVG